MEKEIRKKSWFIIINFYILIAVIMAFPRSFHEVKILPLSICFVYSIYSIYKSKKLYYGPLIFYGVQTLVCIIWATLGLLNNNNNIAIIEAIRLYVIWSIIFIVLIHGMRTINIEEIIKDSVYIASIIISIIIYLAIIENYYEINIMPEKYKIELNYLVGFHEGYIQIALHNIGALFFLAPFQLAILTYNKNERTKVKILIFLITVIAILLTGRRALWIVMLLCTVIIVPKMIIKMRLSHYAIGVSIILILWIIYQFVDLEKDFFIGTIDHLVEAFGADDERTIQNSYLIENFMKNSLIGSGIGFETPYIRNYDRPWLYESTYHVLLGSLGSIGFFLISANVISFMVYDYLIAKNRNSSIKISILLGISILLIAAYSNPYFGSFDFLFYLSFIPLLSIKNDNKNISNNC